MAHGTAEEVYQKWARNLTNSVADVKAGIDRVTESPMQKAAANEEKWFQGLQKAKSSGKFKRGLMNVTLEQWKAKTRDVGADRIPAGATAAQEKSVSFYGKLLPYVDKVKAEVAKMGNVTLQDSIARMTKAVTMMAEFDKTK